MLLGRLRFFDARAAGKHQALDKLRLISRQIQRHAPAEGMGDDIARGDAQLQDQGLYARGKIRYAPGLGRRGGLPVGGKINHGNVIIRLQRIGDGGKVLDFTAPAVQHQHVSITLTVLLIVQRYAAKFRLHARASFIIV